jgi:putative transposase
LSSVLGEITTDDALIVRGEFKEADIKTVNERMRSLSQDEQARLLVLQELLATSNQPGYGKRQQVVAQKLGITVRSVRRLVRHLREDKIVSVVRRSRSDRGEARISEEWQKFIIKTYKEGNRSSRQISPAQVAVRVKVRAQELGMEEYPSHMTVYRILKPLIDQGQRQKRSLGWRDDCLIIKTREGLEIPVEWSNQMWQCDHTQADVLLVNQTGQSLGRPWLSTVIDTYSRCIMGIHLGFDAPSASVVCLALRHAILPKQYNSVYELKQTWGTYGLPQYFYTDGGKDFRSQHLSQVAMELGIVLCLRRKPSDGGIVERPFGTLNSQFFSSLPGYVNSNVVERSPKAEIEACLTLMQLEQLLVRYIVDHYNVALDARMGNQTRIERWDAGRVAQLRLLSDRELDICLMRRDRRTVYRNGYIQFANLIYQGEHLAAYSGESVIIRYRQQDITTIFIYQIREGKEVFLTRAHAQGWETEVLSYAEAQVISQLKRDAGKAIDNRSMLEEVLDRDATIETLQRQKKQKAKAIHKSKSPSIPRVKEETQNREPEIQTVVEPIEIETPHETPNNSNPEPMKPKKAVPYVRVYEDYEQMRREATS